ncbi:hypothetical protein [Streptomyces sp. NPDC048584]|uniref:hypothetical protein n=1 Tax=Streptomyces sp. NPDC048584 TaxID=3365573 RepID=UPI00371AA29F
MYRAKDTFWAPDNRRIVKGDLVAPHDPVVKGREGLFEAVVIPQAVQPAQTADKPAETEPSDGVPVVVGERGPELPPPAEPTNPGKPVMPAPPEGPAGPSTPDRQPAPALAKKTAAKTTAPARKPAGGAK